MNARDKLDAARLKVYKRHPYSAAVLLALRPVEASIGTLAVDAGWRLYYDPALTWSVDELAAVVWHEVNHVLRDHAGRRCGRNAAAWNLAADAEINPDVVNAGWKLPGTPVMPVVHNLLAEAYYDPQQATKHCCGGAAGNPGPWEEGEQSPPVDALDQETLRRAAAQAVMDAGDAPGSLRRWAQSHLAPPKVDWRKQLQRHLRMAAADAAGAVDLSWRSPSRRGAGATPCILPAYRAPKLNVGIILDASGSMYGGPAAAARSELLGIVAAMGPSDTYIADTRVAGSKRIGKLADLADLQETLGGTDMRAAVLEVQAKRKHTVLVLLTDGYTGWPQPGEVRTPLVVAITPGGAPAPAHLRSVRVE